MCSLGERYDRRKPTLASLVRHNARHVSDREATNVLRVLGEYPAAVSDRPSSVVFNQMVDNDVRPQ
jgi:hypothetical protein